MFSKILNYFDRLEDRIRLRLSHHPIVYTFIGAIAIVLFWRGVWHTADLLAAKGGFLGFIFYEPVNLAIVVVILLATGLFVSYFIGDTILISGVTGQRKLNEKTEKEIEAEERRLREIGDTVAEMKKELDEIKEVVESK
jgi:MFS superfamily sulfate permease-like transporter